MRSSILQKNTTGSASGSLLSVIDLTKPDTLPKGFEEEHMYIELTNNERIELQLG